MINDAGRTFEANDVVGRDRPEARGPGAVRETAKQSVSQLFHGPAPRSPLHRLAVRPNTPERQKRQNAPKLAHCSAPSCTVRRARKPLLTCAVNAARARAQPVLYESTSYVHLSAGGRG